MLRPVQSSSTVSGHDGRFMVTLATTVFRVKPKWGIHLQWPMPSKITYYASETSQHDIYNPKNINR